MLITIGYLIAIVAANLLVAHFGPTSVIWIAFLFVGFDLYARDALHERWHGRGLPWRMAALIASGAAISFILNQSSGQIAIASFLAFALSETTDTLVFHTMNKYGHRTRATGSNVAAALIDSVIFPTVAFGVFIPGIIAGQFLAKVIGGALWMFILFRKKH